MSSCNKKDENEGYCLMFYYSGGDIAHDSVFMSQKKAIENTLPSCENISATYLFKSSNVNDNVYRLYSESGKFVKDNWNPDSSFPITEPSSLTDFINWSAERFPGKKYILITGGHGNVWDPVKDKISDNKGNTKSLLYDGITDATMTSTNLATAVKNANVEIQTFITNNCLQGCIETISEWQDCFEYCISCSSYLPDFSGNYPYLMEILSTQNDIKAVLGEYIRHNSMYFQRYSKLDEQDPTEICVSLFAMDMKQIAAVNASLKLVFEDMMKTLEYTSFLTDYPCVYGRSYRDGFRAALTDSYRMDILGDVIKTSDIYDFLINAVVYTGSEHLRTLVYESLKLYENSIIEKFISDNVGEHYISLNFYTLPFFSDEPNEEYWNEIKLTQFDKQTNWSKLFYEIVK